MNFTDHFKKRWKERIDPEGKLSYEEYFEYAKFIWNGKNLDGKKADFHVFNDIIFVSNSGTVMTVYRANYGFDDEINREVCARLKKKVLELSRQVESKNLKVDEEIRGIPHLINQINDQIKVYEAKIAELTSRKNRLNEQISELRRGIDSIVAERDCQAKRLVFTLPLKSETVNNYTHKNKNIKGKG